MTTASPGNQDDIGDIVIPVSADGPLVCSPAAVRLIVMLSRTSWSPDSGSSFAMPEFLPERLPDDLKEQPEGSESTSDWYAFKLCALSRSRCFY